MVVWMQCIDYMWFLNYLRLHQYTHSTVNISLSNKELIGRPKEIKSGYPNDYLVRRWAIYNKIPEFYHFDILFRSKHHFESNIVFHRDLFARETDQGTSK